MGQHHLFGIHLLTASGAGLAVLAVLAVTQGAWQAAFVWLGIALVIDGIDGPIARRWRVRERLPKWDGAALDFVIDYTTYVFVPSVIIATGLGLPAIAGVFAAIVVAVTGALYFADTRMKLADNSFRGFPAVWNMAVFVMFVFSPPVIVSVAIVLVLAALTFVPVKFVHPVRVVRWRTLTLATLVAWMIAAAWLVATDFDDSWFVRAVLLASTLYLLLVAGLQEMLEKRHLRR